MKEAQKEALKSLQTLGYSADQAQEMILKTVNLFGNNLDTFELIKQALKQDRPSLSISFEQHVLAALNRIENKLEKSEDNLTGLISNLAQTVSGIKDKLN